MKIEMTPEEHARLHRRRGRQALGLVIAVLVLIGTLTVLHAGVNAVAKLFDDTAQKQEYEDKLEGLVLFDPVPFEGIENIDDLTLREAAVWGCVYSIQETQGGFDGYNTDPDTEQLLIPSVDVDAYLAKLVGPSFRMTHKTFEMEDMTIEFDDTTQCYKIPVTGSVGSYRATVTKLFKKDGLLHVTVGYIPNQNATDSILTTTSDTPVKYMDYLFSRQSGSWYLTGLTESETKPESTAASTASEPAMMADSEVQDAILATGGDLNGPTLGGILTIMGFSAFGKHARNITPIMLGVVIGGVFMHFDINQSSVQLALLFGTTLAPISGYFGWPFGIVAGFLHSSVVLHAGTPVEGINLYNNGFSGGLLAIVLYPIISEAIRHHRPGLQDRDYFDDTIEHDEPLVPPPARRK